MKSRLLETLADRVLFYDGAMGTQLQARDLTAADFGGKRFEGCNDYLSLTRPDVVEAVHAAYFEAGADAVETNSFQASRLRLEEWGLGEHTLAVNRAAATIARRAADRFERADGRPRFVIGSIGPSGLLPSSEDPELGRLALDDLRSVFAEQAQGLLEGGADALMLETCQDMLEM
jgi:5-methyltetrahydrofolate--homocysteine methyltransferase